MAETRGRAVWGTAGVVVVLGAAATLLLGQEYPHAFPRQGTVKLLENERVAVWEVTWLHGVKQPVHRHRYDMAGVYLRYGPIRVTNPDGSVVTPARYDVPWAYYQERGRTHKEEAVDDASQSEQLAVMTDLKEDATVQRGAAPAVRGGKVVLENGRVRMVEDRWTGGAAPHAHGLDAVEVFVDGGTIRTRWRDGREETREYRAREARFVRQGTVEREEAVAGQPRVVVVELK